MSREVVSVDPTASITDAARTMRANGVSSVMVVQPGDTMRILTERDCVALVAEGIDPATARVGDRMSTGLITVTSATDAGEAAQLMADHQIRHLPVVDRGQLVGMLSLRDPAGRNPALRRVDEDRRQSVQNRVADAIITIAGSMPFVYLHAVCVMINRADLKRQALADHQWELVQQEEQNEQLIAMSEPILQLTQAIHELTTMSRPDPLHDPTGRD
jgi:predicted transcriptional regulator